MSFSVIVCTYNPEAKIFEKLLFAMNSFASSLTSYEIIIVDNNSQPALKESDILNKFLKQNENIVLIEEKAPGLTLARIAGVKKARYEWIIFFDDDNEPASDYLERATELIHNYPEAGCWGPGRIQVEYFGKNVSDNKWLQKIKPVFQEKYVDGVQLSDKKEWMDCYPPGTGLIVKKNILSEYIKRVELKNYTLSDRKGRSLSSGGDVQIVFTGIKMGYKAGIASTLKLTHHIKSDKTQLKYLLRLIYGTGSSYIKAYNQVFFDTPIDCRYAGNMEILKILYFHLKTRLLKNGYKQFLVDFATRMGEINSRYICNEQVGKPALLLTFEKLIGSN